MSSTEPTTLAPGTIAPHFALHGSGDALVCVDDFWASRGLLVAFAPNDAPVARVVDPEFARIAAEYAPRGIASVVILNHAAEDDAAAAREAIRRDHASAGYSFPILLDETRDVTRAYGVTRTPALFLFDPDRKLVYQGQSPSDPALRTALNQIAPA
jgi:peroxiredoxin